MKPTDILSEEHRVIGQVLECIENMARECGVDGTLDKQFAEDAVAFFRTFAEQFHLGKEESYLFPAMEAKGFSRRGGPAGVMLREQERAREYLDGMGDVLEAASQGNAGAMAVFIQLAQRYAELLRQHIQKEDQGLFPLVNQAFTEDDQQHLLDAFAQVEHEQMGAGRRETYLAIANTLADRYNVPRVEFAHVGHAQLCGCGQ